MSNRNRTSYLNAYTPALYRSPICLPEKRSGKVYVKHRIIPAGGSTPVVGMRQAILRGLTPLSAKLTEPLTIHELGDDDHGTWMTDLPEELNQIGELLHTVEPHGNVLVGGLGLGILAITLATRRGVESVNVVERSVDVVNLCARGEYAVAVADIHEYLRLNDTRYDYYLLDTWQGTNESTWWSEVMPQRRAIRNKFGGRPVIHAWAEDIMHGQLFKSLTTKPPHWYYEGLPMPMSEHDARKFLRNVGLPAWEKRYGAAIDASIAKHESRKEEVA